MRICLVSKSNLFRSGLRFVLQDTQFSVDAEASSLIEIHEWSGSDPSVLLIQKPEDMSELLQQIADLKSRGRADWVILLANSLDLKEIAESFDYGVDGYLLEDMSPEALRQSIHLVTLGEKVYPSQLVSLLWSSFPSNGTPHMNDDAHLSEREIEVVQLLTGGSSNKTIANRLAISEATVKVHIKTILKKIGARNRTQAAIWGIQKGMALHDEDAAGTDGEAVSFEPEGDPPAPHSQGHAQ